VLTALRPVLAEKYRDAPPRINDLERLVGAASTVEDFASWLAELTLDPPVSTSDFADDPSLDEDYVVISTIHSAKGLEWPIVHVPHVIDGSLPSDMPLKSSDGLDEERRLFYVAVTRSREELHLYSPLRMPHRRHARDDRHSFAQLSRFVDEDALMQLDVVDEPTRRNAQSVQDPAQPIGFDLDHLWN